jgi:predicted dithiol-disulfide oxidoreductase (DUF899 family)
MSLHTDAGAVSLAALFRGRSQLLIYHFMFGPDYTAGCPSCSSIADGFNGIAVHLENHDVAMMAVSRAPLAKLQAFKRRMGWTFPWASSFGGDFNADFNVWFTPEQRHEASNTTTAVDARTEARAAIDPPRNRHGMSEIWSARSLRRQAPMSPRTRATCRA